MLKKTSLIFCSLFLFVLSDIAFSQSGDYQIANRLMQQQNYEEALPILKELHENNPGAHVFFDRYIECLINLNELEEAERVARRQVERNRTHSISQIRLAEILHIKGDRNEALSIWADTIDRNPESIQTYYSVASSMNKRREYNESVDIYKRARAKLNNSTLFMNELANAYMQAGRFDESVREFYRMVLESPDQMGMVQQRFLRMRDDQLYEVASFELEDILFELNPSHIAYPQLYQLLTWLLLETEEYRRAFNFAQHYENQTPYTIQSLMTLGSQFLSAGQYSYAAEAFRYYADNSSGSVKFRAMEELSRTYQSWSQHLQQHNLETSSRHLQLYLDAYELGEKLLDEAPNYDRADRVFALLIDISLDQLKDVDKAEMWYNRMKNHSSAEEAFTLYAEGRIALFQKNYNVARQALTRADRATNNSNLSERARYYLSLTDFFAGDPEFAEIQLRSLERRHTSFYANDAIKMRMWIKNGQRADTTGSLLKAIGEGLYSIHTGNYNDALPFFEPILANVNNPFADDLTVELSSLLSSDYNLLIFLLLERQIDARPHSALLERMMWDRAVLAEEIYNSGGLSVLEEPPNMFSFFSSKSKSDGDLTAEERFFRQINSGNAGDQLQSYSDFDQEYISNLFEDLIMQFPDGFYAPYAREKIQTFELTYL